LADAWWACNGLNTLVKSRIPVLMCMGGWVLKQLLERSHHHQTNQADMFVQASLIQKYDTSPVPRELLRIVRSYGTQNSSGVEFKVGEGVVNMSIPVGEMCSMGVCVRLTHDRKQVSLMTKAKNFTCLTTDLFATDTGRSVLSRATIHWDAPVPSIELTLDLSRPDLIQEALQALRDNWSIPVGRRCE
jgi:hypothetical protein